MGVAKASPKEKMAVMPMKMEEMKSRMNVNLKKHKELQNCDVGEKIAFTGMGMVTSVRKDEYGQDLSMDITQLTPTKKGDDKDDY